MGNPRYLVAFTSAAAVVIVAFAVAIAVGEWWILPVALVGHAVGFVAVMAFLVPRLSSDRDKPDPVTEARLEEEGAAPGGNGSRRADDREVFH